MCREDSPKDLQSSKSTGPSRVSKERENRYKTTVTVPHGTETVYSSDFFVTEVVSRNTIDKHVHVNMSLTTLSQETHLMSVLNTDSFRVSDESDKDSGLRRNTTT